MKKILIICTTIYCATLLHIKELKASQDTEYFDSVKHCRTMQLGSAEDSSKQLECYKSITTKYPNRAGGYLGMANRQILSNIRSALANLQQAETKLSSNEEICEIEEQMGYAYALLHKVQDSYNSYEKGLSACHRNDVFEKNLEKAKKALELQAFPSKYGKLRIGMSQQQVLAVIGAAPTDKQTNSTNKGVYEAWFWGWSEKDTLNRSLFLDDFGQCILFVNSKVSEIGGECLF